MDHHPATLSLAKFKIIQRERIRPSRLFAGITLLLSLELTDEPVLPLPQHLHLLCSRAHHVDTVRHGVAAASGRTDVLQFILLHRIDFIIVVLIARIVLITLGFAGFFFCRTL